MTTTMTAPFRRLLAVAAVFALLALGSPARAADPPVGAVYLKNTSGVEVKISDLKYTDRNGQEVSTSATWKLASATNEYLRVNGEKILASKISYAVTTPEGTTRLTVRATRLDSDGDFTSDFNTDDLREHRQLLGKLPAGPDPAKLAAAQAEVTRLQGVVNEASAYVGRCRVAEGLAVLAYNRAEPGSFAEIAAGTALIVARQTLSEALRGEQSADSALRAATNRLNSIRYSSER